MKNTFMEIWKDVGIIDGIDFTGLYQVSNYGLVKSLNYKRTGREEILKPIMDTKGYLQVTPWKDGKGKHLRINRLVAIAFNLPIPEHLKHLPLERLEADHIDTNPLNNRLDNLRWTDRKGNMENPLTRQHISESKKGENNPNYGKHFTEEHKRKIGESMTNGKTSKPVLQLDKVTDEVIMEWPSTSEVERQLGFAHTDISACCLGKLKSAHGFKWKYKEKGVA